MVTVPRVFHDVFGEIDERGPVGFEFDNKIGFGHVWSIPIMTKKKSNIERILERLPGAIKAVELTARLTSGKAPKGSRKKVLAVADAAGDIALTPKERKAVGAVNDAIVAAFNLAGLFSKGGK